jgi:hypothetical protein
MQIWQGWLDSSSRLARSRCRDISSRPNWLILPIWSRARSSLSASRSRFSTERWWRPSAMSMKSTTISPATSRRRSWRAISSAASRFVLTAVSSMWRSRVERPLLTSIAVSASVVCSTIEPPECSSTTGLCIPSSCSSTR